MGLHKALWGGGSCVELKFECIILVQFDKYPGKHLVKTLDKKKVLRGLIFKVVFCVA